MLRRILVYSLSVSVSDPTRGCFPFNAAFGQAPKVSQMEKYKLHFCQIYLYMEQISPQLAAKNSERGKSASKEPPRSHRYVEF